MRAIFWYGTGETAALRHKLLEAVFAAAGIPLEMAMTLEEIVAAAMHSRRAGDHDIVVIDCYHGEPSDVDRCVAVATRTRLDIHVIHPYEQIVRDIERIVGRPLSWLPAEFTFGLLLDKLHVLRAQAALAAEDAAQQRPVLTTREREVARLVARGLDNQAIADHLSLSGHTVKSHLHNITGKLGLSREQVIATMRDRDEGD